MDRRRPGVRERAAHLVGRDPAAGAGLPRALEVGAPVGGARRRPAAHGEGGGGATRGGGGGACSCCCIATSITIARAGGADDEAQAAELWNLAFPWAGPAPTLVDLTGPAAAAA